MIEHDTGCIEPVNFIFAIAQIPLAPSLTFVKTDLTNSITLVILCVCLIYLSCRNKERKQLKENTLINNTVHMKTAISIPDKLFLAADQYAENHGFSRSNLYAKAVAQFLEQHPADYITKQLNKVYSVESSRLNKTLSTMQFSSIEKEKW